MSTLEGRTYKKDNTENGEKGENGAGGEEKDEDIKASNSAVIDNIKHVNNRNTV